MILYGRKSIFDLSIRYKSQSFFIYVLPVTSVFLVISIRIHGGDIMKIIQSKVIITIFALTVCFSGSIFASGADQHASEAIKHAEEAKTHGDAGHAKVLLEHAQESLTHAKAAEKGYAEAHQHMTESVKHLEEAIAHAKQGHADVATKHTVEALKHMQGATAE